jgi:hypothetical protein
MNKLLKDAIADAKAVRETALANAKVALEEAFAPKLQSMLSHKIKEEMEGEEDEEPTEEGGMEMEVARMKKMKKMAGLSEEDEEESSEEPMDEPMDEPIDEPIDEPAPEEGDEEEVSDDELEEILRELEADVEEPSNDGHGNINPAGLPDESDEEHYAGLGSSMDENEDPEAMEMDEDIDLDEIINALREEEDMEDEEEPSKSEEELEEAYNVIKFLRSKLNEVNLLNAKLLFVNKLFRKGQLSETQKVKIIETFDRAKNVREAKLIYATLSESVSNAKPTTKVASKTRMNEGFASAPTKKTAIISESNNVYNRFKTLVEYNGNK